MASDGEFAEEASEGSELPDVTVGQQHFVYLKAANKKWLIQDCYVKEMDLEMVNGCSSPVLAMVCATCFVMDK